MGKAFDDLDDDDFDHDDDRDGCDDEGDPFLHCLCLPTMEDDDNSSTYIYRLQLIDYQCYNGPGNDALLRLIFLLINREQLMINDKS